MLATLTSKAQVTLPKDIRAILRLQPGDRIAFVAQPDGQVLLSKAAKPSFASLRGILPQPSRSFSIDEMNTAIAQVAADRQSTKNTRSRAA